MDAASKNEILVVRALRRNVLAGEQQDILLAHEREEPYWSQQKAKFDYVIRRMDLAVTTCHELHESLNGACKMLGVLGETLALSPNPQYGLGETGTLKDACKSEEMLSRTVSQYALELKVRTFQESAKAAKLLAESTQKKADELRHNGTASWNRLKQAREKVINAWLAYEKAFTERQNADEGENPYSTSDPFLDCRRYEHELRGLEEAEKAYAGEMTALFVEVKEVDGRRIDQIKGIMLDSLLAKKSILDHAFKYTNAAIDSVKAIDRETDVALWVDEGELLARPHDSTPPALGDSSDGGRLRHPLPPPTPPPAPPRGSIEAKEAKRGGGERKEIKSGGGGSPSVGSPLGLVGMMNVFEIPPPKRDPQTVTRLYQQEIEKQGTMFRPGKILKSNWKPIWTILTKSGFFHYFEDNDQASLTPERTINLQDCKISLVPQTHPLAFEISVPNSSLIPISGDPILYHFKAEDEESLTEWMQSLKSVQTFLTHSHALTHMLAQERQKEKLEQQEKLHARLQQQQEEQEQEQEQQQQPHPPHTPPPQQTGPPQHTTPIPADPMTLKHVHAPDPLPSSSSSSSSSPPSPTHVSTPLPSSSSSSSSSGVPPPPSSPPLPSSPLP